MKRQLRSILGLGIFCAVGLGVSVSNSFAQVEPPGFDGDEVATNIPTWVTLTDGSRIVVEIDPMETFFFSSEFVEVDLSSDAFTLITFTDGETVVVQFNNGDRLTGQLDLESLLVTTSWGGAAEIEREFLQSILRVDFNNGVPVAPFAIPGPAPHFPGPPFGAPVIPAPPLTVAPAATTIYPTTPRSTEGD